MSDQVTVSREIEGVHWVYCGQVAVKVSRQGMITPVLSNYSAEEIPSLVAALRKAAELAGEVKP